MKKHLLFLIVVFLKTVCLSAQSAFITEWDLSIPSSTTNSINFYIDAVGDVGYGWISEDNQNSGGGTISAGTAVQVIIDNLPEGKKIRLGLTAENLRRFRFGNGWGAANPDSERLVDIRLWGDVKWSSMSHAFKGCKNLTISALDKPDLSNVTDMSYMFLFADNFNADISDWDVSNVTDMKLMFYYNKIFNQDISGWDVSNVTDMSEMFHTALLFNQDLSGWDVSNVTNMFNMFKNAESFNQDLGNWDVSNVTNMSGMFWNAKSFEADISDWDVSNVTDMRDILKSAHSFNHALGSWNLNADVQLMHMLNYSGMDCKNYSQTLIDWSNKSTIPSGRSLGSTNLTYGPDAVNPRNKLISQKGWTITGDVFSTTECNQMSVSDVEKEKTRIYPNPVQDVLFIDSKSTIQKIEVYDVSGKLVSTKTNSKSIQVNQLPKGNYIVKTTTDKGEVYTQKIIKN